MKQSAGRFWTISRGLLNNQIFFDRLKFRNPLKLERFCALKNLLRKSGNILKLEQSCVLGHVAAILIHPKCPRGFQNRRNFQKRRNSQNLPKSPKSSKAAEIAKSLPNRRESGDPLKLELFCTLKKCPPEVREHFEVRTTLCTWKCCQHPWAPIISKYLRWAPNVRNSDQCKHPHSMSTFQAQTLYS